MKKMFHSVFSIFVFCIWTLRVDKVSMLAHMYQLKTLRKIKMTICNHQADSPLYVWLDVWSGDHLQA